MKRPLPYAQARTIADELLAVLQPVCERIEVAGSLRRQRAEIGDLELVAIPRVEQLTNLIGDVIGTRTLLDDVIHNAADARFGPCTINGPKHKGFTFRDFPIDFYLVAPDTWGALFTQRTGNEVFSHWVVSQRRIRGGLPNHLYIRDGRVHDSNTGFLLNTPEEGDVLALLDLPRDLPPSHPLRNVGDWAALHRLLSELQKGAPA